MRFKYKRYSLIALLAILVFVGGFALLRADAEPSPEAVLGDGTDLVVVEQYWGEQIEKLGAKQAYNAFKEYYLSLSGDGPGTNEDFEQQHSAAHIMGELLYKDLGLEGMLTCDKSFSFGCYHGFFGEAVHQEGLGVVDDIDAVCLEQYGKYGTGCQHGIGHGIIEYLGHSEDALVEALEACDLTTQVHPHFGCTSGVFMEYNLPIIFSERGIYQEPRALSRDNLYTPCNTFVPNRFKKSCYYEIGQLWSIVFRDSFREFLEDERPCSQISRDTYQRSCYAGMGNIVAHLSRYDVDRAIGWCQSLAGSDEEGELLCRGGASWAFWNRPGYEELSPELCEGYTKEEVKDKCIVESDLLGTGEKLEHPTRKKEQ